MSTVRLFVLDAYERHGKMHGYQLRAYAERERTSLWTDISVPSLYQVIKRLLAEGLLESVRSERQGNFPERQILEITSRGRESLANLRREGLLDVVVRWDPFDLALTRSGPISEEALRESIKSRLSHLRQMLAERIALNASALRYLTPVEVQALSHRDHMLRSEITWHEDLLIQLPSIDLSVAANIEPPEFDEDDASKSEC